MIDFKKIDEMIELIENNEVPENQEFNDFVIEFFNEVKTIPVSYTHLDVYKRQVLLWMNMI